MTNELYHYGVKGMKWGVRKDPKVASQRGRQAFDNFGITNERLNISGKRSEEEGLARRRAVRNKLGSITGHYDRNKKNINLPQNEAEAKKMGYQKLSKNMSAMHQFVKEDGVDNSKWVSKDGHKEVVFTGAGENQRITTNWEDEGSYNFFNPTKNPLGHAVVDVVPYVLFGNNPNDRTTMETRIRKSVNSIGSKKVSSINKSNTKVGREFAKNHNISGEAWHSELYHHGIKGQKWGVRNDPKPGQRRTGKTRQEISQDAQRMRMINKKHRYKPEGSVNCSYCAISYILNNLFGMDTTANGYHSDDFKELSDVSGISPEMFDRVFDNTDVYNFTPDNAKTVADLKGMDECCKQIPNGSTGILFIQSATGFGHYVNYEKDANGNTTIIDAQNAIIDTPKNYSKMIPGGFYGREAIDCSNATLANGSNAYLNTMVKGYS